MQLGGMQDFYIFIEALVEMKDEYIYIPWIITKLQCVSRDYNATGLPGCVGSMDVVHVKWASCPTGNLNQAKGIVGYPTLAFQCLTDFNAGFWQSMDCSLEYAMTRTSSSTVIMFVPSGLISCLPIQCGSITMPRVTLNQREVCISSVKIIICDSQHQFARTQKRTTLSLKVTF